MKDSCPLGCSLPGTCGTYFCPGLALSSLSIKFDYILGRNLTVVNKTAQNARSTRKTANAKILPKKSEANQSIEQYVELGEKKDEEYAIDSNIWNQTVQSSALRDQHIERLMMLPRQQQTYFPKMVVNGRKEMISSDALPETVGQAIESPYLRNVSEFSHIFAGVKQFRDGIGLKGEALLNMSQGHIVEDRIKRNKIPRAPKHYHSNRHLFRRTNSNVSFSVEKVHISNATNNFTTTIQAQPNKTDNWTNNTNATRYTSSSNYNVVNATPNNSSNITLEFNSQPLLTTKNPMNQFYATKSPLLLEVGEQAPKESFDIMEIKQERNMSTNQDQYEIPNTLFDDIPTRALYKRTSPITINFNIGESKPQEKSKISYDEDPFDSILPTSPRKQLYADETSNVFADDMEGKYEKRTLKDFRKLEHNIQHEQSLRDLIARTLLKHCGPTGNRIMDAFIQLDKKLGRIQKIIKVISSTYGVENTRSIRDLMDEKEFHFVETFLREMFSKL